MVGVRNVYWPSGEPRQGPARGIGGGAALLVDHVLPAVGYRQWVLSFQGPMAVPLGYDQALLATIAESLAGAVMQDMRASVKERHGPASVATLYAGVD